MYNRNNDRLGSVLVWMAGATIVLFTTWLWTDIVFVGDDYVPLGVDAFYHTRRILDTVQDLSAFYEFDAKIHVPEGSWLTWPWGFDYLMALLTILGMSIAGGAEAGHVLMFIPVFWALLNIALMAALCSELKLSFPVRLLAIVCYALLPFTQAMHSFGRIDHHFAEHTFFLLSVLFSMKWFARPDSRLMPLVLGLVLGLAPAIHNGLFILQLPVLLCMTIFWLRASRLHVRNTSWFTASLVLGTAIAVLPSASFWEGAFSFTLLSWLHIYIAFCTALFIEYIARIRFSKRSSMVLAVFSVLLSLVIGNEVLYGARFITGEIEQYSTIFETQSVLTQMERDGVVNVIKLYTMLIILLPIALIWQIDDARSSINAYIEAPANAGSRLAFACYACFGGIFMLFQMRFQYLGTVAMILPLMIFIEQRILKSTSNKKLTWSLIILAFGAAYAPSTLSLGAPRPVGMDQIYQYTRHIYIKMAENCKEDPGVVLAKWTSGHHIRYHTECSVIANNMILTPQHEEKVRLSERLLAQSAVSLRKNEPWIKYVYLIRADNPAAGHSDAEVRKLNSRLNNELLISNRPFPEGYELLDEVRVRFPVNGKLKPVVVARLFRIQEI